MQDSYPIKDTFHHISTTLQNALDTDYVIGLLIATAIISYFIGRLTK